MKPSEFIKEEFDSAEYNDEAGMVKTNLITTIRMALELAKCLDDNENVPEWCQEKIAVAKGMIVAVGDYIISQHAQGIEPHVGTELAENATGGGTGSGGIATTDMSPGQRSQVGSLFGGTYQQPAKKRKAKKK